MLPALPGIHVCEQSMFDLADISGLSQSLAIALRSFSSTVLSPLISALNIDEAEEQQIEEAEEQQIEEAEEQQIEEAEEQQIEEAEEQQVEAAEQQYVEQAEEHAEEQIPAVARSADDMFAIR